MERQEGGERYIQDPLPLEEFEHAIGHALIEGEITVEEAFTAEPPKEIKAYGYTPSPIMWDRIQAARIQRDAMRRSREQ